MPKLTKTEFACVLAERTDINEAQAKKASEIIAETIFQGCLSGRAAEFRNFGGFKLTVSHDRALRNPKSGDSVRASCGSLRFKPSKRLIKIHN